MFVDNQNKEQQTLFKTLSVTLKHCSVSEVTEHLSALVPAKNRISSLQNRIIALVCSKYGISVAALKNEKSYRNATLARKVLCSALHESLGLSSRYIANCILEKGYHNTAWEAIKLYREADMKIKVEREFKEAVDSILQKIKQ